MSGCHASSGNAASERQEIVVFAAASLTDAFTDLAKAFEAQHAGTDVVLHFAGSSQLSAQLREGITADVYASANPNQMQAVIDFGRVASGSDVTFVSNSLTVVVPTDNPANITAVEDLAQPNVQLVLAGKGVPVRQYTDDVVMQMTAAFQSDFYANLVSEEDNVRQVAAKVALGEADAGIIYTSDITPDLETRVAQVVIPDAQNVVAAYPIAPLVDAAEPELAQQFIDFVLSPEGQAILASWGFGAPSP